MKSLLVLAAALGLSVSAAAACPYKNVTASADTDTMTVASIATDTVKMSTRSDARAVENATTAEPAKDAKK